MVAVLSTACGSGGARGGQAAEPPVVAADTAVTIAVYADALASGWTDVSWGAARNFAATSPVASGTRSLAVTFDAYGGLYLNRAGSALPVTYGLELSINPGSAAGGKLLVAGRWSNATTGRVELAPYCAGGAIPAGAWTRCRVPLSAIGPAGGTLDGFWIQEGENRARPTMYLDDVAVTSAAPQPTPPAAPASLAATAGTTSIALSWSGCTGATGYDVYRAAVSGGAFTRLTAAPQASTTYADTAVTAGATYWYQVRAVNAAGAGPASSTASATVPVPPPASTIVAYADALASGWTDVSWGVARDYAATSPVASGSRSLALTFDAYGGLYLNRTGSALPVTSTLELWVNPGAAAGGKLLVAGRWSNTTTGRVELAPSCDGGAIPAGAWTRCRLPLSAIGPAGGTLDGFWIQEGEGRPRPTMYLDDVAVTAAAPTTPPPSGAVTVSVLPASATLDACKAVKLTATVAGATDGSVTWSVVEGAAGGTVDATGTYTAPRGDGVAHVVATSRASPAATATATIGFQQRVLSVAMAPASAALAPGGKAHFAATVTTSCGAIAAQ